MHTARCHRQSRVEADDDVSVRMSCRTLAASGDLTNMTTVSAITVRLKPDTTI